MIKTGRKPSSDPVQEKLRESKALWNKEVSEFINDLINFKKTMNGAPSKFYPEKGNIKEPIPADPASIIGVLAGDFQNIATKGNSIIQQQVDYSKNRRRSAPKAGPITTPEPTTPATINETPPSPANDLSKQLAASMEKKYNLIAEASNPISRFFTRLLNPRIGFSEAARVRRVRMSLLDACVKTYRDLGKLQVEIVKSSKESIVSSNKLLHKTWNDWTVVARGFNIYKINMPPVVQDAGGVIPPSKEIVEEKKKDQVDKKQEEKATQELKQEVKREVAPPAAAPPPPSSEEAVSVPEVSPYSESQIAMIMKLAQAVITDYTKNYRGLATLVNIGPVGMVLEAHITRLIKSPGQYRVVHAAKLMEVYQQTLATINASAGTNGKSLSEILQQVQGKGKDEDNAAAQLETTAQAFLKKWIGRTKHKLNPFDKTSGNRLEIYELATSLRKSIDQVMDLLEKDMNVEELNPMISGINQQMSSLRGMMRALHLSMGGKPTGGLPDDPSFFEKLDMV